MKEVEKVQKYSQWVGEMIELDISKYQVFFQEYCMDEIKYNAIGDIKKLYTTSDLDDYVIVVSKDAYYLADISSKNKNQINCFAKFKTLKEACEAM